MNKKKYHITITDNETGATLTDADAKAIMGAISLGEGITEAICCTHCNTADLAGVVMGCEKIVEEATKKSPILPFIKALMDGKEISRSESDNSDRAKTERDKRFDEFLRNLFGGGVIHNDYYIHKNNRFGLLRRAG